MYFASRLQPSERRLLYLLLAAIILFVGAAGSRLLQNGLRGPDSVTTGPAPAPVELSSEVNISQLQEKLRQNPNNTYAYAQLGLAYLQRVRETADAALYLQAEMAFDEALARDPEYLDAIVGKGILALARHDFEEGLEWGQKARAINPFRAGILGIIVDALVELGRYDEAVQTAQEMVDLRPDLTSYSRVSYLRELHGDTAGAIEAMQAAVDAGAPGAEGTLWTQTQLGNLHFNSGDWDSAEVTYRQALRSRADYPYALAGLAKVQAARGDTAEAIATYETLVERLPLPEFVIVLGELYEAAGQPEKAAQQYDLVRAMQQLNASAGVDVDLELALFDADHGDSAKALEGARAGYGRRPSIFAADVLAWALYRNGSYQEAWQYSQEALRLETRDALLHYHAGMIAYALGDTAAARDQLETALDINPAFSFVHAPTAEATLAELR